MKKISALFLAIIFTFSFYPTLGLAGSGGIENASFSAQQLGRGGAGVARPDEPAAISYNPAGIADLKGVQVQNMIHGTNPYSVTYELHWGLTTFYQPLNYGPLTLIFYLPAMLWPTWIGSIWLGMAVMINVYSYLYSETLCKLVSKDQSLQKYAKIKAVFYRTQITKISLINHDLYLRKSW